MIFIAHEISPFSSPDVTVFTNCDEVRLIIYEKDTLVQRAPRGKGQMPHWPVTFKNVYDFNEMRIIPYKSKQWQKVSFIAEGLIDGKVVCSTKKMPARRSNKLQLSMDNEGQKLIADGSDFIPVICEVTDNEGNVRRLAKENILFTIEGEGDIIGDALIGANPRNTEFGSAPALIRSTLVPGKINVQAKALFDGEQVPISASIEFESIAPKHKIIYSEKPQRNYYSISIDTYQRKFSEEEKQKMLNEVELKQTEFGKRDTNKQILKEIIPPMIPPFRNTQTADSAYVRPLKEVLTDVENRFNIRIKYDNRMIEGKWLKYADWRIKPWSIEESLHAILAPFDYTFVMENEKYKIKEFEYFRTNATEGAKFLDYLTILFPDKTSWEERKAEIKSCLPEALRLSPVPEKPDSPVILTPQRTYDGYTVENFAIETLPGIYVAGSIYKPAKMEGKCPVMLNPNGHFGQGRYRNDQQFRCATQARMGIISANWDLFAWGESLLQFDGSLHRLSVAATIQMLNAIRILDYLLSLKEADPERVGITGASGGGSLTMVLSALDDRITLSIPTVMLSSHFSGGCPCESGMPTHLCGKRTNNVEIASVFAPKPQLILSDGKDWTNTVPEQEYPFMKRIYEFYNSGNHLENDHFPGEGHDYGISKRKSMYRFIAEHFNLDLNKADESKVTIEPEVQMYVFGKNGEKLPPNAIKGKEALNKVLQKMKIY
jgi:hypothetical protein